MKKTIFLFISILLFFNVLNAQPFIEQPEIKLQELDISSLTWVDYDSDGDLDISLAGVNGIGYSLLYRNEDNSQFTKLPDMKNIFSNLSSTTWGDYDNDGDLDVVITDYSQKTFIYENKGNDSFQKNQKITITEAGYGSADWGDYNNDGRLDILLTGIDDWGNQIAQIWVNAGKNHFYNKYDDSLTGVDYGSGKWGDYDNDGDLDILISGGTKSVDTDFTLIYSNEGRNKFKKSVVLCNYVGNAEWGDYNNDGFLDVVVTGGNRDGEFTGVYKNNGDHSFTFQEHISIVGTNGGGEAIWGDYNNDGFSDIAINGWGNNTYYCKLYKNLQNGNFAEDTSVTLTAFNTGECAWGDYDNDGDLDLLTSGDFRTKLYRNDITKKNETPSAPENLKSTVYKDSVILKWDKANDNKTPQNGLSYNLYVYKESNDSLVIPPHANRYGSERNGYRLISQYGKIRWSEKGYRLNGKFTDEYKWSVQAIDAGFAASIFAEEQNFKNSTSIEIPGQKNDLIVYPNPTSTQLVISLNNVFSGIRIIDLTGVECRTIDNSSKHQVIEIGELSNGMYMIQAILTNNTVITKSFIKY